MNQSEQERMPAAPVLLGERVTAAPVVGVDALLTQDLLPDGVLLEPRPEHGKVVDLDHRTVIIHAQLMRPDQLQDTKALGLVPSYYAAHPYFWGDWHRQYQRQPMIA